MLFWVPLVFSLDHCHLSPTTKNLVLNNIRGISYKNPTYGKVLKRNLITEALEFCYLWSSIGRLWCYVKYCDKEQLIYKFWILKRMFLSWKSPGKKLEAKVMKIQGNILNASIFRILSLFLIVLFSMVILRLSVE